MSRLLPALQAETTYIVRKSLQWTIVAALFTLGVWFMTSGLPKLANVINGP